MDPMTAIQNIPPGTSATEYISYVAIIALGSVVAFLYRKIDANDKKTGEKLQECETDRLKLWERVAVLEASKAG